MLVEDAEGVADEFTTAEVQYSEAFETFTATRTQVLAPESASKLWLQLSMILSSIESMILSSIDDMEKIERAPTHLVRLGPKIWDT